MAAKYCSIWIFLPFFAIGIYFCYYKQCFYKHSGVCVLVYWCFYCYGLILRSVITRLNSVYTFNSKRYCHFTFQRTVKIYTSSSNFWDNFPLIPVRNSVMIFNYFSQTLESKMIFCCYIDFTFLTMNESEPLSHII